MNESGLSSSDVLALADRNDCIGSNGFFWVFALLLLNNGGFGYGGNNADFAISQNAQTQQLQMSDMANQLSQSRFDIAQVVAQQTDVIRQQNDSNLINAIQGFNNLGLQITNQTNVLSNQLQELGSKMDSCCCSIKTQMLEDRLSDTQARLVTAQNAIDNANQSQYILSQMGRFVAWAGTGSPAATVSG